MYTGNNANQNSFPDILDLKHGYEIKYITNYCLIYDCQALRVVPVCSQWNIMLIHIFWLIFIQRYHCLVIISKIPIHGRVSMCKKGQSRLIQTSISQWFLLSCSNKLHRVEASGLYGIQTYMVVIVCVDIWHKMAQNHYCFLQPANTSTGSVQTTI